MRQIQTGEYNIMFVWIMRRIVSSLCMVHFMLDPRVDFHRPNPLAEIRRKAALLAVQRPVAQKPDKRAVKRKTGDLS